ncbi:MAG: 23S rRNA (guanosine(2251)-2'-O)-methyltransferase RlmB [Candidatus Puniceispirillaceae bacterium]
MRRKNRKNTPRDADLSKSRPKSGKSASPNGRPSATQKGSHPTASALPENARKARSGHLLYGYHAVMAALDNPERRCVHLFLSRQAAEQLENTPERAAIAQLPQTILDRQQLDQMVGRGQSKHNSPADAPVHQGFVLQCAPLDATFLEEWMLHLETGGPAHRILILDQVTDPRNIGAIMRSALALGASAILMTDRHAPEETGALAKTAAGALEKLSIIRVTNLARALDSLKEAGFTLVGLEAAGATALDPFAAEPRLGLVLGSEGAGMRRLTREGCDHLAAIPISPDSESLNVSVAAAIALYATRFTP